MYHTGQKINLWEGNTLIQKQIINEKFPLSSYIFEEDIATTRTNYVTSKNVDILSQS